MMLHTTPTLSGILLLLCCWTACHPSAQKDALRVMQQTALRTAPAMKSEPIRVLRVGEMVQDLGEVDHAESVIAFGEDIVHSPWIKVLGPDGEKGWMLAFVLQPRHDPATWFLGKRRVANLGRAMYTRAQALQQRFAAADTDVRLCAVWQEAQHLRDTLQIVVQRKPRQGPAPDFSWMDKVLPGFIYQPIGESATPYVFADYHIWQQQAATSGGTQDDAYFNFMCAVFPRDSIESFFPDWQFQYAEMEGASQLGSGKHTRILKQLDACLAAAPLFRAPLMAVQAQIAADIFQSERYWQAADKIIGEMNALVLNPPACFDEQERAALGIRLHMFENPDSNHLRLNLRSGQ